MKLAFVYAGQGSQFAGMGKDLYENYPAARAVFDQFPADFDLRTTCFEDPDGLLNQTRYTQPCMLAVAMAITDILAENGITPEDDCRTEPGRIQRPVLCRRPGPADCRGAHHLPGTGHAEGL